MKKKSFLFFQIPIIARNQKIIDQFQCSDFMNKFLKNQKILSTMVINSKIVVSLFHQIIQKEKII